MFDVRSKKKSVSNDTPTTELSATELEQMLKEARAREAQKSDEEVIDRLQQKDFISKEKYGQIMNGIMPLKNGLPIVAQANEKLVDAFIGMMDKFIDVHGLEPEPEEPPTQVDDPDDIDDIDDVDEPAASSDSAPKQKFKQKFKQFMQDNTKPPV